MSRKESPVEELARLSGNWKPPTLDSMIEWQKDKIAHNPFGVSAEDGYIFDCLVALKVIKHRFNNIPRYDFGGVEGFHGSISGKFVFHGEVFELLDIIK